MAHRVPQCCAPSTALTGATRLADISAASFSPDRPNAPPGGPLDRAYGDLRTISTIAVSHNASWDSHIGLVLSAGAVAAAEDYFRSVLIGVVPICPHSKQIAGSMEVALEHVESGNLDDALRSALESSSLSSSKSVKDATRALVGLKISKDSALGEALDSYETICHVRHCSTHAGGYVGARNAEQLGASPGSWLVFNSPAAISSLVVVLMSTLRTYNQQLFSFVVSRWIDAGRLTGHWRTDRGLFEPLWQLMASRTDVSAARQSGGPSIPANAYHAYRTLSAAARQSYEALGNR